MMKFNIKLSAVALLLAGLAFGPALHAEKTRASAPDSSAELTLNKPADAVPQQKSMDIFQRGFNNFAAIEQNILKGLNNYASIEQSDTSAHNHAVIIQAGNYNRAGVTQRGMASTGHIYQMGQSNRALINQH